MLLSTTFDLVLAELSWQAAKRRPQRAFQAWKWCPVAWNEVIWLPLPGVDRLLCILVRQDREEGFGQIAFVAAERSLQRRAALAALVQVTIDDLAVVSIHEMASIPHKLERARLQ